MLVRTKNVLRHLFVRMRLVVLARNLVFAIPWSNLNQVCSKQTSSTGTPGSTPARTQLVVLAQKSFSTKHQFERTSFQKDQLCADKFFTFFHKSWPRSKLQKLFPQRWPRRCAALSECRNASTLCHSQHANALLSKEWEALINSSFTLLTPGDFAISSPRTRLTLLAAGRQLHHT